MEDDFSKNPMVIKRLVYYGNWKLATGNRKLVYLHKMEDDLNLYYRKLISSDIRHNK